MSEPKSLFQHLKEVMPVFSGGNGIVVILAAVAGIVIIPWRVSSIEEHDKLQDSRLAAIEQDASQRRELLASVAATVQSIDLRTRRIEDALTKH
jgi:uncharacterized membrane protein